MDRNVRMRRVVIGGLAGFASVLALSVAFAQAPQMERGAEKAAVAQVFRDYIAAFSEGDPKKIAPYYDVPVALVLPMVARSLATPADTEKWLETTRADMRKRGVESVTIDDVNVKILGKSIALLSSSYRRLAKDGKVLERGASTYFLRKTEQGWKISAVTAHPPEDTVKLD